MKKLIIYDQIYDVNIEVYSVLNMKELSKLQIPGLKDRYYLPFGFSGAISRGSNNILIPIIIFNSKVFKHKNKYRTIVHECVHTTEILLGERGLKLSSETSEAYAYYIEWLFSIICKKTRNW